jgi:hypothetical protein
LAGKHWHLWTEKKIHDTLPGQISTGLTFYSNPRNKYFEGHFVSLQFSRHHKNESSNMSFLGGKKFRDPESRVYVSGYVGFGTPIHPQNSNYVIDGVFGCNVGIEF